MNSRAVGAEFEVGKVSSGRGGSQVVRGGGRRGVGFGVRRGICPGEDLGLGFVGWAGKD